MNTLKKIATLFSLLQGIFIYAQIIKGEVVSEKGDALSMVRILLKDKDDKIIGFTYTSKNGEFILITDKMGDKLNIKALNYKEKDISIKSDEKKFLKIILEEETIIEKHIKEVNILKHKSRDTINIKTINYIEGNELNIEDMLKKIPGITIENNGKIKYRNKDIQNVLVEDDDLFERGYQVLTQNMPSKNIEKIQILKKYNKNKLLKDLDNNENYAINLILKEDIKNKWFGNTILASTSYKENLYQIKLNLMNFSKNEKIYFLFNGNNYGIDEMKGVDNLINPSTQNKYEGIEEKLDFFPMIKLHNKNITFEDMRVNFNNDKLYSISYLKNFNKNTKIKYIGVFNSIQNYNYIKSSYNYNYDNMFFRNNEIKEWNQNKKSLINKIDFDKQINETSHFGIYYKNTYLKEGNDNIFLFNDKNNNQTGHSESRINDIRFVYTKKLSLSNVFVIALQNINLYSDQTNIDRGDMFNRVFNKTNIYEGIQDINSKINISSIKSSYIKNITKDNKIELQFENKFKIVNLYSSLNIKNSHGIIIDRNMIDFYNQLDVKQYNAHMKFEYSGKYKKFSYRIGGEGGLIYNNLLDNKIFVAPTINLKYENGKKGNIIFNINRRITEIDINNIYNKYIYSGDRIFRSADISTPILSAYNIGAGYNIGNPLYTYFNIDFQYSKSEGNMNNYIINPNYTLNTIQINKNKMFYTNTNFSTYIKWIKSKIQINNLIIYSERNNTINHKDIRSNILSSKWKIELKSGWGTKVNYELGYEKMFNKINSKGYIEDKGYLNLYINNIMKNTKLSILGDYYKLGNESKEVFFLDFKLDYTLKNIHIFLYGRNLLNIKNIERYKEDNISESSYIQKLLPRSIMIGINANF